MAPFRDHRLTGQLSTTVMEVCSFAGNSTYVHLINFTSIQAHLFHWAPLSIRIKYYNEIIISWDSYHFLRPLSPRHPECARVHPSSRHVRPLSISLDIFLLSTLQYFLFLFLSLVTDTRTVHWPSTLNLITVMQFSSATSWRRSCACQRTSSSRYGRRMSSNTMPTCSCTTWMPTRTLRSTGECLPASWTDDWWRARWYWRVWRDLLIPISYLNDTHSVAGCGG